MSMQADLPPVLDLVLKAAMAAPFYPGRQLCSAELTCCSGPDIVPRETSTPVPPCHLCCTPTMFTRVAHSPRGKSLKRQAAELLLASRYTQTPRTPHHSLHGSHHHPSHPHSLCSNSSSSVSSYSTNVNNTPAAQQKHAASTSPSPGQQQQQQQPQHQAFSSVVALAASLSQKAASASAPHLHKLVPTAASTALQSGAPHVHAASVNVAACAADCSCKNGPGWCQFKVRRRCQARYNVPSCVHQAQQRGRQGLWPAHP